MKEKILKLIEERKPNEYAVRYYKTLQARTWEEKKLIIEALEDLKEAINNI